MTFSWISWLLLTLAYLTFGRFLHLGETTPPIYAWVVGGGFAIALAATMTFLWKPTQRFLLMGFGSDAGYFIMVMILSSLAVGAVVQFRMFSYVLVLVAASLLVRVDTLISDLNDGLTFLIMIFFPILGLGVSWLPWFYHHGYEAVLILP